MSASKEESVLMKVVVVDRREKVSEVLSRMLNEVVSEVKLDVSKAVSEYAMELVSLCEEWILYEIGVNSGVNSGVKSKSKQIPLPWPCNLGDDKCEGLVWNYGLQTQCQRAKGEGGMCVKCEPNRSTIRTVSERLEEGADFKDKKGRKLVAYVRVMSKLKLSEEDVRNYAHEKGVTLPEDIFVVPEKKNASTKKSSSSSPKSKPKSSPKSKSKSKSKTVQEEPSNDDDDDAKEEEEEDIFANLSLENPAPSTSASMIAQTTTTIKGTPKLEEEEDEMPTKTNAKAKAKTSSSSKDAEKAALKATKDAEKAALKATKDTTTNGTSKKAKGTGKKDMESTDAAEKEKEVIITAELVEENEEEEEEEPKAAAVVVEEASAEEEEEEEEEDEDEEEEQIVVKKFEHNGIVYMKSQTGTIYDAKTQDELGIYNESIKEIEFYESE